MGKHLNTEPADVHFKIERWLLDQIQYNADNRELKLNEWWIESAKRHLSSRETVINEKWDWHFTKQETTCLKCQNKIPSETRVMHSPDRGVLCPRCWANKYGDRGTLMLLEQEDQLKENIRVLRAEQNALIKEVEVLNHNKNLGQLSDKCMEVQKVSNDLVRKNDEILNLAEDYFKHGYAPKEQKMVFEKLCKETDMFHEQREKQNQENEALKPLARHLEDFDKAYIQERLKKRKSLNEVPAEYS